MARLHPDVRWMEPSNETDGDSGDDVAPAFFCLLRWRKLMGGQRRSRHQG